jgi:penicillin-binding protein 2
MYRTAADRPRPLPPLRRSRTAPVPISDPQVPLARLRVFALLIVMGIGTIMGRLWYLQVYQGDTFRARADNNRLRPVREVAPRGLIQDARGRVLVTNSAQFTVFVVPLFLPKDEEEKAGVLRELARILEVKYEDLLALMRRNESSPANPIAIAEGVSDHVMARIAENRLRLPGVVTDVEPVRMYPEGKLAAHLLGYIGPIDKREIEKEANKKLGYKPGDFIGKAGVERSYDQYLCGEAGAQLFEVDARGRRRNAVGEEPVVAGATLTLGLDRDVQKAAEDALAGRKGAAVAVDPRDGRVIAYVSSPAFDPTLFARRPLPGKKYRAMSDEGRLLDRASYLAQPPGSTYKVVTSVAGLATGKITEHTGDFCAGGARIGNRFKRCHSTHGGVNLIRALEASCDVFYYHAGLRMGPDTIAEWSHKFGLGERTGIDLPSEEDGLIPTRAWKRVMAAKFGNPDSNWYPGETANMAIGQGDVLTTPLQMALVAAAIGNGGTVYKPRVVVKAVSTKDGKPVYQMEPTVTHRLGLTPQQIALVARGMRAVVAGGSGTSRRAALPGIAVAGKSGSAEVQGNRYLHAWFICYAPFENPTIAICVFLDADKQKLHGGSHAAPVARKMMAAHFRIKDIGGDSGGRAAD